MFEVHRAGFTGVRIGAVNPLFKGIVDDFAVDSCSVGLPQEWEVDFGN